MSEVDVSEGYTLANLNRSLLRDDAVLLSAPKYLNCEARISFRCHCGAPCEKIYSSIAKFYNVGTGAFCTSCVRKTQKRVKKRKFDEILLEETLSSAGAQLVSKPDKLNSRAKITFKCTCSSIRTAEFGCMMGVGGARCLKCVRKVGTQKVAATKLKRYGASQKPWTEQTRTRIKETFMSRFGVTNPTLNENIRNKVQATNMRKLGVAYPFQSKDVQQKITLSHLKRYSVPRASMTKEVQQKAIETNRERYHVNYPLQNPEIFSKQRKSMFAQKAYEMPSGKIVHVQGYEPLALSELLTTYEEDDIVTSTEEIPAIRWTDTCEKEHTHYPDIYIPKYKLIIEVKSEWVMQKQDPSKVLSKLKHAQEQGYGYQLWIYNSKGEKQKVIQ